MRTKANRLSAGQALANAVLETLTHAASRNRLLGTWTWNKNPSSSKGKSLRLRWRPDDQWERRVLDELRRMSNHELADIGLSRSDLTLEGLAIAGSKRARRQDAVAAEIAKATSKTGADSHGD